jgi:hypothetical protein
MLGVKLFFECGVVQQCAGLFVKEQHVKSRLAGDSE